MAFGSADKTIGVWRVSSEERIKTLIGHSGYVNKVVFSPNEEYLASGSSDDTMECGGYQAENVSKPSQTTLILSTA